MEIRSGAVPLAFSTPLYRGKPTGFGSIESRSRLCRHKPLATPPGHHVYLPQAHKASFSQALGAKKRSGCSGGEGKARALGRCAMCAAQTPSVSAAQPQNSPRVFAEACRLLTVSPPPAGTIERKRQSAAWLTMVELWGCTRRLSRTSCWARALLSWSRCGLRPPQGRCVRCVRVPQAHPSCPTFESTQLPLMRTPRGEHPCSQVSGI